jgi:hypothetical protein
MYSSARCNGIQKLEAVFLELISQRFSKVCDNG